MLAVSLPVDNSVQPRHRAIHRFADRQCLVESDTGPFAVKTVPHTRRIGILPILLHGAASRQSGNYLERCHAGW